jgi:hypothetical protein
MKVNLVRFRTNLVHLAVRGIHDLSHHPSVVEYARYHDDHVEHLLLHRTKPLRSRPSSGTFKLDRLAARLGHVMRSGVYGYVHLFLILLTETASETATCRS